METKITVAAILLLIILAVIGIGVYRSNKKLNNEKYYFLGFIILLFTVIYAVSILDYDISDKGVRKKLEEKIEKTESEVTEVSDIVAWTLGNLSRGGDRNSYERLLSLQERVKNPEMAERVSDEVRGTGVFYDSEKVRSSINNYRAICKLSVPPCAKGFEPIVGYDAKNVYDHLDYSHWFEKARAASLLINLKTATRQEEINMQDLCGKLVKLMQVENEDNLFVAKMAFETYKALSGFRSQSSDPLDFKSAINDWSEGKRSCTTSKN